MEGHSDAWKPLKLNMQVAQVKKVLASVGKICGAGNRVVFDDEEGSFIENKKTGKKTWLVKRNGVYYFEMWVRKKPKGERGGGKRQEREVDEDGDTVMQRIGAVEGQVKEVLGLVRDFVGLGDVVL